MTEQILRSALNQAIAHDPGLAEWFMTRINLSHRAKANFLDPVDFTDWGYDSQKGDMIARVDNCGQEIMLHIVPLLRNLGPGTGPSAIKRAKAMQAAQVPMRHLSLRIVLVAPGSLVRQHWHAAREFPYWVDFDALTKRQLGNTAA